VVVWLGCPSIALAGQDDAGPGFNASLVHELYPHTRFSGSNRYATAAQVAMTWGSSYYAVIASGENWPDGLVAAPLAKKYNCPILLNPASGVLASETRNALNTLGTRYVFVMGSSAAIASPTLETQLFAYTAVTTTVRVYGSDRYATAKAAADRVGYGSGKGLVVTGEDWPDAVAGASSAAYRQYPILLTRSTSIPSATGSALNSFPSGSDIIIVGSTTVVSPSVETAINSSSYPRVTVEGRAAGSDRYATAREVVKYFGQMNPGDQAHVCLVNGLTGWPDALSIGAWAGKTDEPVLYTTQNLLPKTTRDYLVDRQGQGHTTVVSGETLEVATNYNTYKYVLVGSTPAISRGQEFALDALQWRGVKYIWGGEGPALDADGPDEGFDCAGLTWYAINYRSNDWRIHYYWNPRYPQLAPYYQHTAAMQRNYVDSDGYSDTSAVSSASITGHQVFYGSPITHTGFYLGNSERIDAPQTGDRVRVRSLGSPSTATKYWSESWPWVEW
jgi:cell wall-associated NlpC family hydrolase